MNTNRTSRPGEVCRACLDNHKVILGKFGPAPVAALRAMSGYGLSEREIARYFGVTPASIRRLRRSLDMGPAPSD